MKSNVREFNPFARITVVAGQRIPPGAFDKTPDGSFRFSIPEWLMGTAIHDRWKSQGAFQMRQILNRDRHGKAYLNKFKEFIPVDPAGGITSPELFERYQQSVSRQLAA
jgi:hypothetical protein